MNKKITTEEIKILENKIWSEFLERATPLEIHKSVITSNFDGNSFLLKWIKDNPKTDKGTILQAYWLSSPSYFKEFKNREALLEKSAFSIDGFDFVEEIERKFCSSFYQGKTLLQRNKNRHEKVKINNNKNQLSESCLILKIYISQEIGKSTMSHCVIEVV